MKQPEDIYTIDMFSGLVESDCNSKHEFNVRTALRDLINQKKLDEIESQLDHQQLDNDSEGC